MIFLNFLLLFSLILAAVSGIFSLVRQFQMLQQNSYFASRYFNWVTNSFAVTLAAISILYCGASLLYSKQLYAALLALVAVMLTARVIIAVKTHKKSIKKLVLTSRVKRLFAAAVLIEAVFIVLYCVNPDRFSGEVFARLSFMLSFITPLFALVCSLLTLPIEKAAAMWYVNDAKRILREYGSLKVVGITGSYGKTTTKFILKRILSEKYNVVATPQSFNTPMGVVKTIRNDLKHGTEIFICEMGAKKVGDIKEICDIVNPDYGIITYVGEQHLDTFKSVENVFKTKFELADAVRRKGGTTLVNGDSKEISARISDKEYSVYKVGSDAEFYAENIVYGRNGSAFDLVLNGERISVTTKLLGLHSVSDIVGAAALAFMLGVEPRDIKYAVGTLKAAEHRLELKSGGPNGALIIDDAYNANPVGCLEAVRVLGSFDGMKKIIITPGLIELGEKEYECNYNLGLEAAKYCDIIILVGKNRSKPLTSAIETTDFNPDNVYVVSSFKEAMAVCAPLSDKDTVILLENDLPDNYLN